MRILFVENNFEVCYKKIWYEKFKDELTILWHNLCLSKLILIYLIYTYTREI